MKHYLVFKGSNYYPTGGWEDFAGDFDTIEEARVAAACHPKNEWSQIIDTTTKKEVE